MSTPEALRLSEYLTDYARYAHETEREAQMRRQKWHKEAAAALRRQHDELERLTACLKTANANHEHFEREWYLRGDEIERLTAALDEARAERSVAYLAFEQVTKERDASKAEADRLADRLRIMTGAADHLGRYYRELTAERDALWVANAAWREIGKSALCVLCALRDANDWHPNMIKDLDGVIDAVRSQGEEPSNG